MSVASVSWLTGLWLLAVDNPTFWHALWAGRDDSSARSLFALAGVALVLWALLSLMVRLLCWPRLAKPAVVVLLLAAAAAAHFIGSYGILIDKGMIRNVLQTDWREASDLASLPLLIDLALRGLLPAALVVVVRIEFRPWRASIKGIAVHAALTVALALAFAAAFFGDYASAARNQRELRHMLTPTNVANGFFGLWKEHRRAELKLTRVGEDARRAPVPALGRPLLVVLMVGETARAANFSLGGYGRSTNQALDGKDVVYFPNVTACGTDTATSLPCMFSDLGAERFSVAAAGARENVLDILTRAGVSVRWLDNNSGCKGICQRVASVDLSRGTDPAVRRARVPRRSACEGPARRACGLGRRRSKCKCKCRCKCAWGRPHRAAHEGQPWAALLPTLSIIVSPIRTHLRHQRDPALRPGGVAQHLRQRHQLHERGAGPDH